MKSYGTLLIGALLLPSLAGAHATPVEYAPQASAILQTAPKEILIRFSERIEPKASGIEVYGPSGVVVSQGTLSVQEDKRTATAVLNASGTGTYTVSWRVVSADDGHYTQGGYSFAVGKASSDLTEGARFQIVHRRTIQDSFAAWLEMMGHAFLIGSLAIWFAVGRMSRKEENGKASAQKRITVMACLGCVLIIAGNGWYMLRQGMTLTSIGASMQEILIASLQTTSGQQAMTRMLIAIVFAAMFFWKTRREGHQEKKVTIDLILWTLILLFAVSRARISHASASPFHPGLSVTVNVFHLLAKNGWIGILGVSAIAVPPLLFADRRASTFARFLTVLSAVTSIFLAIGGVTGVYITWLHLKSFDNVLPTEWGKHFVGLTVFAALLLALRLRQQLFVDVLAVRASNGDEKAAKKLEGAWTWIATEAVTGLGVLFFSSLLIVTTPPVAKDHLYEERHESQGMELTLKRHPYDSALLLLETREESRKKEMIKSLTVTLTNASRGVGPIVADMQRSFDDGFVLPLSLLSPQGSWTIDVSVQRADAYDATAKFTVRNPEDFTEQKTGKSFGSFEGVMLIVAAMIVLFSVYLFLRARHLQAKIGKNETTLYLETAENKPLILTLIAAGVLLTFFGINVAGHLMGPFQSLCEYHGHMWHESVPMREGRVTSSLAVPGCMTGMGLSQSHFADEREYEEYIKPTFAAAKIDFTSPILAGEETMFTVTLQDQEGNPARDLVFEHDRILHAVIIGRDLTSFAHVHAEDKTPVTPEMLAKAQFPISATFPKAGKYSIALDFTIRAQTFTQMFVVDVTGAPPMIRDDAPTPLTQTFENSVVTLHLPKEGLASGKEQKLSYDISDGDKPATLRPYLAAAMHIAVTSDDLRTINHIHGELPQNAWDAFWHKRRPGQKHVHAFLPDIFSSPIDTYVTFPKPGRYVLFGQFRKGEMVRTTRFVVEVK